MLTPELIKLMIEKQDEWRKQYKINHYAYKIAKNRAEKARYKESLKATN